MSSKYYLSLICCVAIFSGCQPHGMFVKRESEMNCPTDIRKTVPWCAGEDAIFCCPCGPNEQFHGHKPTCWRPWQSSGAEWRDFHCQPISLPLPETGMPGSFPVEQVTPPIEVLSPTEVAPDIQLPDSEEREPSSSDFPPTAGEESLPDPEETPQQLEIPSDTTSSRIRTQLPLEQKTSEQPLTSYFYQENQVVSNLVVDKALSQPEPGLFPPAVVEPQPGSVVLLQPVELEKVRVPSKAIAPNKMAPAEPLDSLASQLVVIPTAHIKNPPAQPSLWVVRSETVPTVEPAKPISPSKNAIAILEVVAEKPSRKNPVRLTTQGTALKKKSRPKSLPSSGMMFVR